MFRGTQAGQLFMLERDVLGNVTEIRQAGSNAIEARYEYDAWGGHRVFNAAGVEIYNSATGVVLFGQEHHIGVLNPLRYRGYYWDTDIRLYYLKSRYYDPEIMRFVNADDHSELDPSSVVGLNLYAYCGNDPINNVDPDGTSRLRNALRRIATVAVAVVAVAAVVVAAKAITIATKGAGGILAKKGAQVAIKGILGAAKGATSSAASSIIDQTISNEDGSIDWVRVGQNAVTGAITGAASSSLEGLGLGRISRGLAVGGINSVVAGISNSIRHDQSSMEPVTSQLSAFAGGFVGGFVGGGGEGIRSTLAGVYSGMATNIGVSRLLNLLRRR